MCASKKLNVEEVRQKIKVRNLAETKCTQSESSFAIRCYGDHAELPNQNLRNFLEG